MFKNRSVDPSNGEVKEGSLETNKRAVLVKLIMDLEDVTKEELDVSKEYLEEQLNKGTLTVEEFAQLIDQVGFHLYLEGNGMQIDLAEFLKGDS